MAWEDGYLRGGEMERGNMAFLSIAIANGNADTGWERLVIWLASVASSGGFKIVIHTHISLPSILHNK